MPTATQTTCIRPVINNDPAEPTRTELTALAEVSRQPWAMRIGNKPMIVRPSTPRPIGAAALLQRRCRARARRPRYRSGGGPPAGAALDWTLRNPLSFVAATTDGSIVATVSVQRDPAHGYLCAEAQLLVEDRWQRLGIGTELISHIAGVAQVAGYHELIAYPATAVPAAQRLMVDVGRTRMVPEVGNAHLHTYLPDGATLGLGSVRQRLAG